ncbi:hypothetical protein ACN9ML_10850 [Dyadobacter endophyticus]|uniref:DUF2178 domain-containing protein n=1 Tax=Dyadobacter endophyticus TaxID=1749036 RepID=A0ABQ1YP99_9BACT|nr:hypothetical protein [Dyadobacter endophyticus]GGH32536.1 hypothetical protein GCM10007423_22120 [Dyadobacter endophyticus]
MKKRILTLFIALLPALASAQTSKSTYIDRDQIALGVTVLLIAFILVFLLELTNRYFQYRLREKVLESGVTEQLAALLLKSDRRENLQACIKWLAIFLGLALGFTIIALTNPPVWAALAALSLCLSVSFMGYYIFLKRADH